MNLPAFTQPDWPAHNTSNQMKHQQQLNAMLKRFRERQSKYCKSDSRILTLKLSTVER